MNVWLAEEPNECSADIINSSVSALTSAAPPLPLGQPNGAKTQMSDKVRRSSVSKETKKSSDIVRFKTSFRNTIFDVMRSRGWKESDGDWDIYWADREIIYELFDNMHLENGQKVNHFRNGREVQCFQQQDFFAK